LNWTFLDPTRTPRLKSSLANERSRQLLFDISARNLALEIQSSYYRLQEARELREDYNRIYELTRKQVVRAIQLRKAGAGTQGDVDQLRAQLFQQLVQLIQIYEQEVIAANQLAYTLSLEPGQLLLPSEKLRPSGTWSLALQATIEEALALREEIKSSLARAEQYGWSAKARLNSYLPSVSILGQSQLNTNNQLDQTVGSTGWSETISRGVRNDLGLTFKWLMFDGGVTVAESQALREQANSAKAQAANDRLEVTLQVQNSYATYNSSNMVIDTSQEQLREARKSVEYTARVYNGSTIAATVFIQSIQSYLNASQAYKSSVRRFNTALAALYRYSARWPEGSTADLKQRLIKLSGS
jgi:outer membrane protein TolC